MTPRGLQSCSEPPPEPQNHWQSGNSGIVGQSVVIRGTIGKIERVAPYYRTALLTGETGTGKELAARALHDLSKVREGPFVTVNCSAVVETLFESELFGHVKGAFTDASRDKIGLFELAHKGTLFLDEIGDMPLGTQAKLLRVLQNQEVWRVGAVSPRKVELHVVAATNKNLRLEVEAKRFREDLYYRLSMIEIEMPPLRDRSGDIAMLADFFGLRWAASMGKAWHGLSREARTTLENYAWPGNVRELENVIGHAVMMSGNSPITPVDMPQHLHTECSAGAMRTPPLSLPVSLGLGATDVLEEYERRLVVQALEQNGQNQARAARALRTSRDRLRYKMKKFGLLGPQPAALCA